MVTRDFTQGGVSKSCFWPILTRKMKFWVKKYFFSKENPIFSPNLIYCHHTMSTLAKNSKKHILTIFLCDFPLEWLQGTLHREDLPKAVFGQFWPEKWKCWWKNIFLKQNPIFFPNLTYGHHTMCTLAKNSKKRILTIFLCDFPLHWLQGKLHKDFSANFHIFRFPPNHIQLLEKCIQIE